MSPLVVDTSAVVAILKNAPGWERLAKILHAASPRCLSVASGLELSRVIAGRHGGAAKLQSLDRFLAAAGIERDPVDARQVERDREGFLRFGKGRHPAGLNFGDGFSYALAKALDAPLRFVGEDFGRTDVRLPAASGE